MSDKELVNEGGDNEKSMGCGREFLFESNLCLTRKEKNFAMKSKLWVIFTVLVIACMVLVSCAPKATPPPPATKVPETAPTAAEAATPENTAIPTVEVPAGATKVTIFVGMGTGTDSVQIPLEKAIEKEFNDTHQDIKIEFLIVPYEERQTKFQTMLAGDMAPDIMLPIGVAGIAEFIDEWADITPYIEQDKYDTSRFIGKTVELHKYPGKGTLGLPLCVYPSVVYYNSDMFDAAGVEYPPHKFGAKYADGSDWNMDKVIEISKKLTVDAAGNNADSPAFDLKTIKQFGWNGWDWASSIGDYAQKFADVPGNLVSKDYKTALFNDPAYVDALTWTKKAVWDYHIQANTTEHGAFDDKSGDPMGSGMVGMWEIQSWMGYAYDSWDQSFNWDVAAIPNVTGQKIVSETDADTFTIPKASKHKDQAWEVIKWLYEPAMMKRLTDIYSCIPADKQLAVNWKDEQAKKYPKVDFQVFIDALDYADVTPNHEAWHPEYAKINDIATKANDLIMTGENLDVNAVLNDANKEAQALLDEYWKTH
jgi:multiple sugar transport system substrate-binding protein